MNIDYCGPSAPLTKTTLLYNLDNYSELYKTIQNFRGYSKKKRYKNIKLHMYLFSKALVAGREKQFFETGSLRLLQILIYKYIDL